MLSLFQPCVAGVCYREEGECNFLSQLCGQAFPLLSSLFAAHEVRKCARFGRPAFGGGSAPREIPRQMPQQLQSKRKTGKRLAKRNGLQLSDGIYRA